LKPIETDVWCSPVGREDKIFQVRSHISLNKMRMSADKAANRYRQFCWHRGEVSADWISLHNHHCVV